MDFISGADHFDFIGLLAESNLAGTDFLTLIADGNLLMEASGATGQGTDSASIANQQIVFDADGAGGEAEIVLARIEDFIGTLTFSDFLLA